jgi:hypothetical protein
MESSIIEQAKQIAEINKKAKEKELEIEKKYQAGLRSDLKDMTSALFEELDKLHRQANKHGTFSVIKDNSYIDVIAYIAVNDKRIAWFKANIINGEYNYSDDCSVPYTEPLIWARIYPPDPNYRDYDGTLDIMEKRWYHNGGRSLSCSSVSGIPKFFEEMAKILSVWF